MAAMSNRAVLLGAAIGLALMGIVIWGFKQPGGILGMILLVGIVFGIPAALLVYGLVVAIRRLVRSGAEDSPPS